MLDKIQPALYSRLRTCSRLSRKQFAAQLNINRETLRNYETGKTRPDLETERKMIEVSGCSNLELVEMLCELLSDELDVRVAILEDERGYRPTSALARAARCRDELRGEIPARRLRQMGNAAHTAQLIRLALERHDADLDEMVDDCLAEARERPAKTGATGAAAERLSDGAATVLHIAGTGRRTGERHEGEGI